MARSNSSWGAQGGHFVTSSPIVKRNIKGLQMVEKLLEAVNEGKSLLESVRTHVVSGDGELPIRVTRDVSPRLFVLHKGTVRVSTWQSAGIATYAGMGEDDYLVLCALLGLVQLRAIERNPSLMEEDCWHTEPAGCLYVHGERKQDYAERVAGLHVCAGCMTFYAQLDVAVELTALHHHIAEVRGR